MRYLIVLLLLTGCAGTKPAPNPQIPMVDIPSTARDFPEPEWEEPIAKFRPEDAEELMDDFQSIYEYMMLQWDSPPPP